MVVSHNFWPMIWRRLVEKSRHGTWCRPFRSHKWGRIFVSAPPPLSPLLPPFRPPHLPSSFWESQFHGILSRSRAITYARLLISQLTNQQFNCTNLFLLTSDITKILTIKRGYKHNKTWRTIYLNLPILLNARKMHKTVTLKRNILKQ